MEQVRLVVTVDNAGAPVDIGNLLRELAENFEHMGDFPEGETFSAEIGDCRAELQRVAVASDGDLAERIMGILRDEKINTYVAAEAFIHLYASLVSLGFGFHPGMIEVPVEQATKKLRDIWTDMHAAATKQAEEEKPME